MESELARNQRRRRIKEAATGYLLLLPVLLVIFLFVFWPMVSSLRMSFFKKQLGISAMKYVGWKNYKDLFKNALFKKSLINSLIWTVASTAFQFVLGMICALILNQKFRGRGFWRGLFIVPWVVPPVVVAIIYRWLLNGLFGYANQIFQALHLFEEPLGWFSDAKLVMPVLIFINVWRGVPFMMITLLAGMQTIPMELYEAAKVDGASSVQRFFHVTIPNMKYVISIGLLIYTLWNFNNFDMIYLLTKGGPGTISFTLPVMIYSAAFEEFQYGKAAAISTVMFLILAVVAFIYLRLMHSEEEGS